MRTLTRLALAAALLAVLLPASVAQAQTYSFSLDREAVDAYWQSDGTLRLVYTFAFTNDAFASPIDYVDVGLPTESYYLGGISASIDGRTIRHVAPSEYVSPGIELGLGSDAIRPGSTGVVQVEIGRIEDVLFSTSEPPGYVSAVFSPTWFDSDFVHGTTDFTVTIHLPPGVQPDEGRWFNPPRGWSQREPTTTLDKEGRVTYIWHETGANGYTQYEFGVAFPAQYVLATAVAQPSLSQQLGISTDALVALLCIGGFILFFAFWIGLAITLDRRRKLAYLPPKISIEGHGIKRGLTAVEAAVLLETPLDRVLTMILFSVIKKNAARLTSENPLTVERLAPAPEGLRDYEEAFLNAVTLTSPRDRHKALQAVVIDLVKAVQKKMKGFSLPETRAYYKAVIQKAWEEVEKAGTPEIRSQRFDEGLEWTMLDRDFEDRTRRTFQQGPVFVPVWWGNYRPTTVTQPAPAASRPVATGGRPSGTGPSVSMPHLPGSDFAASVVTGVQNAAGNLVGNVMAFTSGVTSRTNPPPVPSRASGGYRGGGGGGRSCACACACAGCACACAGGGR